jgi:cytosine/adenosine deaminase-related metal-dependent hydrolase
MTRAFASDLVFLGEGAAIADGAVIVDDSCAILDAGPAGEVLPRHAGATVTRLSGLLMPGLVNAHTHVELSHMRGKVPGGAGFMPWLERFLMARAETTEDEVPAGIDAGVRELVASGTVAVGDVSNTLGAVHSLARAHLGGSVFHEVFGYDRARATARLLDLSRERGEVVGAWPTSDLAYTPAPHTLYTTHPDVVRAALREARSLGVVTSIHLGEHAAEREFLEHGTGPAMTFAARFGIDLASFPTPHLSPFAFALELGVLAKGTLAVHVTTATRAELDLVAESGASVVLCPRSNLYIEVRLPAVLDVLAAGLRPALGTDSLASNTTLDVLAEAKAIAERFAQIPAHEILRMATANGADALGRPDLGRFTKGARPGVLHVAGDATTSDPLRHFLSRPPSVRRLVVPRA